VDEDEEQVSLQLTSYGLSLVWSTRYSVSVEVMRRKRRKMRRS
jgi:hypothetical protein